MVRYWAAARAAATVAADAFDAAPGTTLADLLRDVVDRRGEAMARVVAVCSVLIDEQPVGTRAHAEVLVHPGQVVELLPPFAGG